MASNLYLFQLMKSTVPLWGPELKFLPRDPFGGPGINVVNGINTYLAPGEEKKNSTNKSYLSVRGKSYYSNARAPVGVPGNKIIYKYIDLIGYCSKNNFDILKKYYGAREP